MTIEETKQGTVYFEESRAQKNAAVEITNEEAQVVRTLGTYSSPYKQSAKRIRAVNKQSESPNKMTRSMQKKAAALLVKGESPAKQRATTATSSRKKKGL